MTVSYAKAVQGMPPADAVRWAHGELVKRCPLWGHVPENGRHWPNRRECIWKSLPPPVGGMVPHNRQIGRTPKDHDSLAS